MYDNARNMRCMLLEIRELNRMRDRDRRNMADRGALARIHHQLTPR
jgi:hypothetical protein